jgi:hypothetical protein
MKASQWAIKAAKEGFQIPISQSVLDSLVGRVDDPSVRDLSLRAQTDNRVALSGLKKKGVWVEFSALFQLRPPGADDPGRSLVLDLEKAEPFFARNAVLTALDDIDGVAVTEERVLVDLDDMLDRNEWVRKIPKALRSRLRIADVGTEEGRINLRIALS